MKKLFTYVSILLVALLFTGCFANKTDLSKNEVTLNVGLYPYVPRLEQFKQTIQSQWKHENIKLNFVSDKIWDGGYDTTPKDVDVFVFDAANLNDFVEEGYIKLLKKSDIKNFDDLLDYAKDGMRVKNSKEEYYYGIPQLGCGGLLFFRKDDEKLKKANTLSEITNELGQCTYDTKIPPKNTGLMFDLSGKTTNGYYYLEASQDIYGVYNPKPPMAPNSKLLSTWALNNISLLRQTSSVKQSQSDDLNIQELFSQGYGRAYVGYSESMASLSKEARENIDFKYLPFSNNNSVHLFYSDIAAINAKRDLQGKEKYAVELLNILTSKDTFVNSVKAVDSEPAQYLLPVRHSTFDTLSKDYPLYGKLRTLVYSSKPSLYTMDVGAKSWIDKNAEVITSKIYEYNQCQ